MATDDLDDDILAMIATVNRIVAAHHKLEAAFGRYPTDAEVAAEAGLPLDVVAKTRMTAPPPIKLG